MTYTGDTPGGAAVHLRSYASDAQAHAHPFHQLVLPLAGRLELEVRGRGGQVADLSGVIVPAGDRHAFCSRSVDNRFVVLDLPPALVEEAGARGWIDRRSRAQFFAVPYPAMRLAALLADEAGLEKMPPEIHRAWAILLLRAVASPAAPSRPAAVERALAYIEARALGPVSVADVARAAGVSPGHLAALFRASVRRTPRDVVLARRLDAARGLLTGSDAPIAEIALRCGFADQASLTHAMRRVLGVTPGELRRTRI
jgi:AraC-like DNA-binding protein